MRGVLAGAIARDILAARPARVGALMCFACDRPYSQGDGRFCSERCRAAFDAGLPPYERAGASYGLTPRGDGFLIDCAGCRRPFASKGLRCCSIECERLHRERQEIAAIVHEVGGELPAK